MSSDSVGRLRRLAAEVGAFWGAGLRVRVEDGPPCFDWEEIRIPPADAERLPDSDLACLLAHEWGHRCIAPRTVEQGMWWQLAARMEGIRASAAAVNIACDLLVDHWYMEHPGWGETYRRAELDRIMSQLAAPLAREQFQSDPAASFLLACYERIGGWSKELTELRLDRQRAAAAIQALFDEGRVLDDRVRGFLQAGAPALRTIGTPAELGGERRHAGPGHGGMLPTFLGVSHPWVGPHWDAAALVRLLAARPVQVGPNVLEEVCGIRAAREVRAGLKVLESLVRVERDVQRFVSTARGQRAEGTAAWRIGDPSHELDAVLTLERAGLLLPGLTTLRRRRARQATPDAQFPRLCLVMDNSGSTAGEIIEAELDAAIALLEAARRLRVEAGAIVFGSDVHIAIEPSLDHSAIARVFAGLCGQSGGTNLTPALVRAAAMLPPSGDAMATVIFTDTYVYDTDQAAQRLKPLIARGPVVIFGVETSMDRDLVAAVRQLSPGPRLVQYQPGQRLVDEALAVLH